MDLLYFIATTNSKTLKRTNVTIMLTLLDGHILLGLISFDMVIALHFLIVIYVENQLEAKDPFREFMCQFNGFLSPLALESQFAYHCCLCHCILNMISTFHNKKGVSYIIYHLGSLSIGLFFAILSVFIL